MLVQLLKILFPSLNEEKKNLQRFPGAATPDPPFLKRTTLARQHFVCSDSSQYAIISQSLTNADFFISGINPALRVEISALREMFERKTSCPSFDRQLKPTQ